MLTLLLLPLPALADFAAPLEETAVLRGEWPGAELGFALVGAGDVDDNLKSDLLVGAPADSTGGPSRGRAALFLADDDNKGIAQLSWTVEGLEDGGLYGGSLAGGHDLDGDGFDDIAVGCAGSSWMVDVYGGGHDGPSLDPDWSMDGGGGGYGHSMAMIGDADGDGYAELAIGAPGWSEAGEVHLHPGGATGLGEAWILAGEPGQAVGEVVSAAGDLDGDGLADLISGPGSDGDGSSSISLFLGGSAGPSLVASGQLASAGGVAGFGVSLAGGMDLNGDALADIFVGADGIGAFTGVGQLLGWAGGVGGPSGTPSWTVTDGVDGSYLGRSLALVEDVNGDGHADLLAGRPGWTGGEGSSGGAVLFLGGPDGPLPSPDWTGQGEAPSSGSWSGYGLAVTGIGDMDGDGHGDVAIGVPYSEDGEVIVLRGRPYTPSDDPDTGDTGEDTGDSPEPLPEESCGCGAPAPVALLLALPAFAGLLRRRRHLPDRRLRRPNPT